MRTPIKSTDLYLRKVNSHYQSQVLVLLLGDYDNDGGWGDDDDGGDDDDELDARE